MGSWHLGRPNPQGSICSTRESDRPLHHGCTRISGTLYHWCRRFQPLNSNGGKEMSHEEKERKSFAKKVPFLIPLGLYKPSIAYLAADQFSE